jgi:hypothetical protein
LVRIQSWWGRNVKKYEGRGLFTIINKLII